MKSRIMIGAASLMAAVPATAQYYPPPPTPGQVVGQILGYGRYPYGNYGYNQYGGQARAIDRCARAVEARINRYSSNWYRGANYNRYRHFGRVEGITRVDRKSYGFKVWGVASSGYGGYQGWNRPGYGSFGYGAGADLRWDCRVEFNGRVRDIDVDRRSYNWRGY